MGNGGVGIGACVLWSCDLEEHFSRRSSRRREGTEPLQRQPPLVSAGTERLRPRPPALSSPQIAPRSVAEASGAALGRMVVAGFAEPLLGGVGDARRRGVGAGCWPSVGRRCAPKPGNPWDAAGGQFRDALRGRSGGGRPEVLRAKDSRSAQGPESVRVSIRSLRPLRGIGFRTVACVTVARRVPTGLPLDEA